MDGLKTGERAVSYEEIDEHLSLMLAGYRDPVLVMASLAALVFERVEFVSWCGFYLVKDDRLLVGPYQGKFACLEIAYGRGVCGAVVESGESLCVKNVHEFPGHIACDAGSMSELVVPVFDNNSVLRGVFDLDSYEEAAFSEADRLGVEMLVGNHMSDLDWV